MSQLEERGKGIVLMHDLHPNTAEALPELLRQLKHAGFKVVHMVPREQVTTIAKYDEILDQQKNVSSNTQPAPANIARAHHRGGMYMYIQGHGLHTLKKLKIGTH